MKVTAAVQRKEYIYKRCRTHRRRSIKKEEYRHINYILHIKQKKQLEREKGKRSTSVECIFLPVAVVITTENGRHFNGMPMNHSPSLRIGPVVVVVVVEICNQTNNDQP